MKPTRRKFFGWLGAMVATVSLGRVVTKPSDQAKPRGPFVTKGGKLAHRTTIPQSMS